MKVFTLLSFLILTISLSFGQNNDQYEIEFKAGKFTPESTIDFKKILKPQSSEKNQNYVYRLIQFYDIPSISEKRKIEEKGIEFLSYIPNKSFFAKVPTNLSDTELNELNVRSLILVEGKYKLSEILTKTALPSWAVSGNDIMLNVKYFSKTDEDILVDFINQNGGKVIERLSTINNLSIQFPSKKIKDLADNPLIQWIEPISPPSTPDDTGGKVSTRSNTLNTSYNGGRKYDGSGVSVALSDDGVIGPHIDFEGRVTLHTDLNSGDHGDMTSGIFVGAGNLDPTIGGMAPGADIHIFKQGSLIFLSSYEHIINGVENMTNLGIVTTSTSYSQGEGGIYDTSTEFTDQQIHENRNIIHVLSAGNSGTRDHNYGAGAGWANITGGIKAGKNVICVGNVNQNDALFITSGRGPAADGRIKPDLCAKGEGHTSTNGNNTYQAGAGTSAAAPAIAGVTAQLYQAYREHNDGEDPETGLLKAALLNTAKDLGNPGPDYKYGWGRINALKAVRIIEEKRYQRNNIAQGGNNVYDITVPENVSQVKIMTYWMDIEGNPNSAIALVNDINMQVVTPNAEIYNPLVLDPTPSAVNLDADAVQGIDNLNNVEQVTIDNPVAGVYKVNLNGFAITQGLQTYYVLYDFIYDEVELTYPIGGESLVPGETESIRWDASEGTDFFSLEYSTDGGSTFNGIGTTAGSNRSYNWTVPDVLSNDVTFKINRENSSSQSDTTFTIAPVPQNLAILSVCPDTIELGWDTISGVSMYEVSLLGEKYMDSIGVSTTNTFKVSGLNPNEDHWFSVRSIISGSKGRRAIAINKPPGTENCILNYDLELVQILSPAEGIISSCRDLENTPVNLNINNIGTQSISDIGLNYQINNGSVISESFTGNLLPGENIDYTFTSQADLSGLSNVEIKTWISLTTDENYFNDTIRTSIEIFNSNLISSFPYTENFQTFTNCGTTPDCEQVTCPLSNGWNNYTNFQGDDIDWRTDDDGTGTGNTGPSTDYDMGTSFGKYLYLEGTDGCNFREAILFSPCIDLTAANCAEFEFAYHMFGQNMGELHVDITSENGESTDVVNPIIGNQGDAWKLLNIDLTPFIGETINVKIRGIIGNGVRSDIAIDAMTFNLLDASANFTFDDETSAPSINFINSSLGNIDSYLWDFGDGNTTTEANPTHDFQAIGTYDVTLVVMGSCGSDTITQTIMIGSTAVNNLNDLASEIDIYPNPTNNDFTIEFPQQLSNQNTRIELVDILGQRILYSQNKSLNKKVEISISDLADGVYFLNISGENFEVVRKIIKH